MIIFSQSLGRNSRIFLAMMIILSGSFLNGDAVLHGDFVHYYRVYNGLLESDFKYLSYFGGGIEVGLPIIYLILGKVFGTLNPSHFMTMQIFVSSLLFYIWLEMYAMRRFTSTQKALCVALSLMLFDFWFSAWLVRQVMASIFILYALTSKSTNAKWIFFLIAVSFHTTSILFYPILYLLYNRPKIGIFITIIICFGFCYFIDIIEFLWHLKLDFKPFIALKSKLYPYIVSKSSLDASSIGARNLLFCLILLLGAVFYIKNQWKCVIIGLVCLYFCSVFISAHFSIRIGVLLIYVAFGYFLFLAGRKQPFLLQIFCLCLLLNLAMVKSVFGDLTNTRIYHNNDIYGEAFYFLKEAK